MRLEKLNMMYWQDRAIQKIRYAFSIQLNYLYYFKTPSLIINTFQIVYSKLSDLLPAEVMAEDDPILERPSVEELEENTDRTRQALERVTQGKIAAAMPVRCAEKLVSTDIL